MILRPKRILKPGILASLCLLTLPALAKNKPTLPDYVLRAHTVAVVVDPDAGMSLDNPEANQTAQKDVETAILKWGRFEPILGSQQADLVIVVRKGHGKLVQETIPDPRQNSRAGVINQTDGGIGVGAQHGRQPSLSGGAPSDGSEIGAPGAHSKAEIGSSDDSFVVYQGNTEHPLEAPAVWRWTRKDAPHTHDVPAVAEFRKAIAEAEKQAAKQPASQPTTHP